MVCWVCKRSMCSKTAMDGLGARVLRAKITGVEGQERLLGSDTVGLLDVSDDMTTACV